MVGQRMIMTTSTTTTKMMSLIIPDHPTDQPFDRPIVTGNDNGNNHNRMIIALSLFLKHAKVAWSDHHQRPER